MIDMIVDRYGEDAIAAIAAAYRDGASDADALEAGTGIPAEQLYADFYAEFGVDAPQPVPANPIPPSNVDRPAAGEIDEGGVDPNAEPGSSAEPGEPGEPQRPPDDASPAEDAPDAVPIGPLLLIGVVAALAVGAAVVVARRTPRRNGM